MMRLKAFTLFGKLAKVVGISKKHFFKGEVKRGWVSLMLHCQDPCPSVAQVNTHPPLCPMIWGCSAQGERCLGSAGTVSYWIFSSHSTSAPSLMHAGIEIMPGTPKGSI